MVSLRACISGGRARLIGPLEEQAALQAVEAAIQGRRCHSYTYISCSMRQKLPRRPRHLDPAVLKEQNTVVGPVQVLLWAKVAMVLLASRPTTKAAYATPHAPPLSKIY